MASHIHNGRLEVKQKKGQNIKFMLICAAFCPACILMGLFCKFGAHSGIMGIIGSNIVGEVLLRGLMIFGGGVFGYGAAVFFGMSKSGKPLFTADEYGITDHSAAGSSEILIPWSDIKNIYIYEMRIMSSAQKIIGIELYDTESYLDRLEGHRRKNIETNIKMGCAPVNLTFAAAEVKPEDVLPDIISLWKGNSGGENLNED